MEVHVRNVPEQSTENGFKKFMKEHFEKLSIRAVNCQKRPDKRFASLTFLHLSDAQRFLAQHGQAKLASGTGRRRQASATTPANLFFRNQRIYFEKSHKDPDPLHLRTLAKEEKDRQMKLDGIDTATHVPDVLPISFDCYSVSCGVWSYAKSDLVFAPELTWTRNATAKFGQRSIVLTMDSNQRIDFSYLGIEGITAEDGALIISMLEPPHFSETSGDIYRMIAALTIHGGINRRRTPFLDEHHKEIVGNCLVYRIVLLRSNETIDHDKMQLLRAAHGVPSVVIRHTNVVESPEPLVLGIRKLQNTLSSSNTNMPFILKFQIQKLVQNNYLHPGIVAELIRTVTEMTERSSIQVCVNALRKLFPTIPYPAPDVEATEFQLDTLIEKLKLNEELCKDDGSSFDFPKSGNVAIIHRVTITPTRVLLYGPEPETTNRVLRKYSENQEFFIRVQFCEEDGMPVRFNQRVSNVQIYHQRFRDILRNGIEIAERRHYFLGFSHSSLRAQSCWFVAPFIQNGKLVDDRTIIRMLGEFSGITSPAKCAARIGQTFSDTPLTVKIDPSIVRRVPDVERNGRVFSDGCGTISTSIANMLWNNQSTRKPKSSKSMPTCFQGRYAGAKGMWSVDSRLEGDAVLVRPSQIKFEGSNITDIEICESARKPLPAYLNRQFIKILEDWGVPADYFLKLQDKEVQRLRMITDSPINAATFLERQSIGDAIHLPWLIEKLARMKLNFRADPFLRNVLEITFLTELRALKHKTRIPVEKGYHLHGIMDETGTLEEGQIYCTAMKDGVNTPIVGKRLIISRAPALHPGDVQIVEGVEVDPERSPLAQLSNCIVFSRKGSRDLPSMLSGGDLDGDRYYVIYDEDCQPTRGPFRPADYPRLDPIDIGRVVTRDDMTDFFIQFMETDQLGRIAVLHRVLADQRYMGTLDPDCITLAEMHSTAVDFSKTGIPVDMGRMPKYNPWRPDFEAPGPYVMVEKNYGIIFEAPSSREPDQAGDDDEDFTNYRYYESHKVLGKLYRAIDDRKLFNELKQSFTTSAAKTASKQKLMQVVWDAVQHATKLIQWEHKKEWARDLRDEYEEYLWNIMTEYSDHPSRPLSELEAFVGNILGRTGAQSRKQRESSKTLKERFADYSAFVVNCIVKDGDEFSAEALERSIACLAVSMEERKGTRRGEQLQSFKYVAAAVCLREVSHMHNF